MPQFLLALLVVFFLIVSLLMILIVLIQKPQGGGLSGAFGGAGAGSSQTAFGARTGDVLTLVTIGVFLTFMGTAIGLNYMVKPPAPIAPTIGAPGAMPTTPPPAQPLPETQPSPEQQPPQMQTPSLPEIDPEREQPIEEPAEQPAEQPETPPAQEEPPAEETPPAAQAPGEREQG